MSDHQTKCDSFLLFCAIIFVLTEFDTKAQTIINVPADYATIGAALNAASNGDTVLVAPGTYQGSIQMPNKFLILASWFLTTEDTDYISQTILDGNGGSRVISIPNSMAPFPTIVGFTIQDAEDGISPDAKFNILNCHISDCSDGIDYEDGSGGLCKSNVFENNSDDGIDLDNDVDIIIEDNIIRNNGDDGIEVRLQSYSGPVLNCIIRRNLIYGNDEDGIQLIDYNSVTDRLFLIERNLIFDNAMVGLGCMGNSNTTENYEGASIPERIYLFNNTFVGNNYGVTGGDSLVSVNNIFVDHPGTAMKNVDGGSIVSYGIYWNNGTDFQNSNWDNSKIIFSNPLLNAQHNLQPGSPAIDAGTAQFGWEGETVLYLPSGSYNGTAPDLGAFESTSSAIRFANIGDYGDDGQEEEDVSVLVDSWSIDFIFTNGDNNYPDGAASTIDDNIGQYYREYIDNYQGSYPGNDPPVNKFFTSLGNHDWRTRAGNPEVPYPYLDYFTLPGAGILTSGTSGNERYYDFIIGPVHFFAIDSDEHEPDGRTSASTQAQWLQSQLAVSTSKWKVVFMHHPPFSSSSNHGSETQMQWPYEDWGADVVFAGHDHTYERILKDDNNDGILMPYFVNGLGGRSRYSFGTPIPGSVVRYADDFGAMLIEANADNMTFQFYSRTGQLIDTYVMQSTLPGEPPLNWTWYVQSINVVPGSPGHADVTIAIRADSQDDEGRLGDATLRGNMSGDLFDFTPPGAATDPIIQTDHLMNYTTTMSNPAGGANWQSDTEYNGSMGNGALVTTGGMAVITLRFFISNPSGSSNISLGDESWQQTYEDDNTTLANVAYDNGGGDVSLPVELFSFNAIFQPNFVALSWITESEVNNLGFEIYRSFGEEADYRLLSGYETNPDLTGQGYSSTRHEYSYNDESVELGTTYWYKLADVDFNGVRTFHDSISVAVPKASEIPTAFKLHPNYPNPFNPTTTLRFDIPHTGDETATAKLFICNSLGQVIKTLIEDKLSWGTYEVEWHGRTDSGNLAASGIYFAMFKADGFSQIRKIILIK